MVKAISQLAVLFGKFFNRVRFCVAKESNLRSLEKKTIEIEKLKAENLIYKETLATRRCLNCGESTDPEEIMSLDEYHLRHENASLREEIDRLTAIAEMHEEGPLHDHSHITPSLPSGPNELDDVENNGDMHGVGDDGNLPMSASMTELAAQAMQVLIGMTQMNEPLWFTTSQDGTSNVLNEHAYMMYFPRGIGPKPAGFRCEASRETRVVMMKQIYLVKILMDVSLWSRVFCGIVSSAMILEVLARGVAGNYYNGALQVMKAEFQVPSPLVATRESYFLRYCKQLFDGTWAVVDVSMDPSATCRRRPSGCLIQELPNGYSKVTWVEHMEVDDRGLDGNLYKHLVNSGIAFGAKRWVAALERQCERLLASFMETSISTAYVGVLASQEQRKNVLKLAEKMMISFCGGVSASNANTWITLPNDVRLLVRQNAYDRRSPPGLVFYAATSFWFPLPPARVFDFLSNLNFKTKWDIMANGRVVQVLGQIASGGERGNCVSLIRDGNGIMQIQESCTDGTGSFIIYSSIDIDFLNWVLNGGEPRAMFSSGIAILPDGTTTNGNDIGETGPGGSLLTVAFQLFADSMPTLELTNGQFDSVINLVSASVDHIKASLSPLLQA